MKKLLISTLTTFLLLTTFSFNIFSESENKTITENDLEMDLIYKINEGDVIKFSDNLPFKLTIQKYDTEFHSTVYDNITEFVADRNYQTEIRNFSIEDRYIIMNEIYEVTFDLRGKGDNFIKQSKTYGSGNYAFLPDKPTYEGYVFMGWYIDEDCLSAVTWDGDGEYPISGNTTFYAKWEQIYLKTIKVSGDAYVNPGDNITLQIIPYYSNGRVYEVKDMVTKPKISVKENDVPKPDIEYDEVNDGYFYTYTVPITEGENTLKFSLTIDATTALDTFIVKAYEANPEEVLENDGWPFGTNFTNNVSNPNTVSLNIKTIDGLENVTYQWQVGNSANGKYTDITDKTNSSLNLSETDAGKWYRCFITFKLDETDYTVISKAVLVLDSKAMKIDGLYSTSSAANSYVEGFLSGLYISNGYGAYCLGNTNEGQNIKNVSTEPISIDLDADPRHTKAHFFSILGIYNDGVKDHWTTASFDEAWSIYMKDSSTNSFIGTDNIESIICRFNDYDSNDVLMDVEFNQACDAAIYTDTCVGDFPSIYYADGAAVKAIVEDGEYKGIDIITRKNFKDANLMDACGFTFRTATPTDIFDIDARENGDKIYSSNDYTNAATYDELLYLIKDSIFDYNYGIEQSWDNGHNPFVINTYKGKDVVIGMSCKDGVFATSYKNVDSIKFKMAIGNANKLGIDNIDPIAKPKKEDHHHDEPSSTRFIAPKTGIN